MTSEIVDLDAYRASFVAQTRTRLRKAGRPPRRRRRNSTEDVVVDLLKRRDDPPKPHMPTSRLRWRTMPQPARYVPDCYPTVGGARQLAEWLLDWECSCRVSHVESRCAEIVIEKADAGQIVTRGERSRLLKTANRVRARYAEDDAPECTADGISEQTFQAPRGRHLREHAICLGEARASQTPIHPSASRADT